MATRFSILGWENHHGQRRLAGYGPRGHKGSDAPEHAAQYPTERVDRRPAIRPLMDPGHFHLSAAVSLGVQAFVQLSAASVSKTVGRMAGLCPRSRERGGSARRPQPGVGSGGRPPHQAEGPLGGPEPGCDSGLPPLHSDALCFLYEREASVDGICRVSGGRAHHQVLSRGKTLSGLQPASQPWGRRTRAGQSVASAAGVVLPQGKCARLALVLQIRADKTIYCPFFPSSVLSLEISFRARGALHAFLENDVNEFRLFMAALGLRCCVEASGGSLELGPPGPRGAGSGGGRSCCCLECGLTSRGAQV